MMINWTEEECRIAAGKAMPWAKYLLKVACGHWGFKTYEEYETFKNGYEAALKKYEAVA